MVRLNDLSGRFMVGGSVRTDPTQWASKSAFLPRPGRESISGVPAWDGLRRWDPGGLRPTIEIVEVHRTPSSLSGLRLGFVIPAVGGIRTHAALEESASYRFLVAGSARSATAAVAHYPKIAQVGYLLDSGDPKM